VSRVGFAGHQGLPPDTARLVDRGIRDWLAGHAGPDLVGVTMLGPSADQLFARAVLDAGGALLVVVPAEQYRDGFPQEEDRRGYDELFARRADTLRLDFVESTQEAHMAGGRAVVDASDVLVAAWDGQPARGHGGTADVVAYARQRGLPVEVIWPQGATRD
jgi:hypothetical protein